jgi:hypothetical protein
VTEELQAAQLEKIQQLTSSEPGQSAQPAQMTHTTHNQSIFDGLETKDQSVLKRAA